MTKNVEFKPFRESWTPGNSSFFVWNTPFKSYSKQLPNLELMAIGTMNTIGITTMKRLMAILEVNVALDLDEGIGRRTLNSYLESAQQGSNLLISDLEDSKDFMLLKVSFPRLPSGRPVLESDSLS
jgi:hypothetical protein